jgi:hypothetical protein
VTVSAYSLGNAALARPRLRDAAAQVADQAIVDATAAEKFAPSEIPGVSDQEWTAFVRVMKVADLGAVGDSNELGMFALRPRRLGDFGIMKGLKLTRLPSSKRMAWTGDFENTTQKKFLKDAKAQYDAFTRSMRDYVTHVFDGSILPEGQIPDGATLSGALAILHRCGPSGLKTWGDESRRFADTITLFEKANGIF